MTGWCDTTTGFPNCSRRVATTHQGRAKCWCVKGGTAESPSSTKAARCPGRRSRHPPSRVCARWSLRSSGPPRPVCQGPSGSGCRRRITRGARRPVAGHSRKRPDKRRPRRARRWPCPALRPKRSALRAPQGCAPGKANDPDKSRTGKGATSNEVRKGTFLKRFDRPSKEGLTSAAAVSIQRSFDGREYSSRHLQFLIAALSGSHGNTRGLSEGREAMNEPKGTGKSLRVVRQEDGADRAGFDRLLGRLLQHLQPREL